MGGRKFAGISQLRLSLTGEFIMSRKNNALEKKRKEKKGRKVKEERRSEERNKRKDER